MAKKKKKPAPAVTISRRFESLAEFAGWLADTPITPGFDPSWGSINEGPEAEEFTNTPDFNTANSLMLAGWDSGAADVNKIMLETAEATTIPAKRYALSVAGCVPCVPAYLAGSPANMIAIRRRNIQKPIITICYNCAVGCDVEANEIQHAAAKLLNVIRGLEMGGIGVNLWVCTFSRCRQNGDEVTLAVKIKSADEPFNLLNMAYPLIHPSFNRRHKFAFIERCGVDYEYWDTYGAPITDESKMKEMATDAGISNAVCFCYDSLSWMPVTKILEKLKK